MSLTQALNAAMAGLNVTQQSLSVTAGNIANAQTPGYVRKTLEQQESAAGTSISVVTGSITRQLNQLVLAQLQTQTSGASFATKLSDVYQQLQNVYGTPGSPSGLDTLLNGFATALQSLQSNPSSPTAQSTAINAQVTNTNSADAATSALLDQRDKAVAQLAQLMDINVIPSSNNQIYVYTGSGT